MICALIQQLRADVPGTHFASSPLAPPAAHKHVVLSSQATPPQKNTTVAVNDVSVELFLKQLLTLTRRKAELDLLSDYRY